MVELYNHNLWTRTKWQQERDAARVPAGACPSVSVAADLDRFHVDMGKAYSLSSITAARRLEERVRTYIEAVRPRYPAWANRVAAQVGERIRIVADDLEKVGRAREGFNKAVVLVRETFEPAETDIEDWLASGGETRLSSRNVSMLVAGLRDIYVCGQHLPYVTDRFDRAIATDARKYWSVMDSRRPPDRLWLEGVNDLRVRLRPV